MPKIRRRWRHMFVRFLPTQEWSVGERDCIGGFWYYWQYMTVRFLLPQEWSTGGRGLLANTVLLPPEQLSVNHRARPFGGGFLF